MKENLEVKMKHKIKLLLLGIVVVTFVAVPAVTFAFTWSPPTRMGSGREWDVDPEAVADRNGNVYVVWTTYPFGRLLLFNSFDGSQWTGVQRVTNVATNNFRPDIAVGPSGLPHIVWTGFRSNTYGVLYTRNDGTDWTSPTFTGIMVGGYPTIAVDSAGHVFVANWHSDEVIRFVHGDGHTWSTPVEAVRSRCRPDLSVDQNDVVYLTYCDSSDRPAFRTWLGDEWSDETHLEGFCGTTYSKIEMFHSNAGEADLLCFSGNKISHWHRGTDGWQGPTLATESHLGYCDVTGGPNGIVLAIWAQGNYNEGNPEDIFVRVWTGSEWLQPENVSNTPFRSLWTTIGLSSTNQAVAIWSENPDNAFPWVLHASTKQIEVNHPPSTGVNGPYSGSEGTAVSFDGTGSTDPDDDPLSYAWDFGDDQTGSGATRSHTYADNGTYNVCLTVTDSGGLTDTQCTTADIVNIAPTVGALLAPSEPIQIGTAINVSAEFTDPGVLDTHTAVWDWGDSSTSPGTVDEMDGSGSVTGGHSYATPGIYAVKLTVVDKDGGVGESIIQYVVVYDPDGGFVTGGGWIDSPEGAYGPDPSLTGKATFGFVSKYKKGADAPTGQTEFQFHVANLNFHSDNYDWLVVAGHKAMYKGVGTINGTGNYGFMLSAIDEKLTPSTDVDLFRIKIWDKDNGDAIVYDNQIGAADDTDPTTAIGGGNIVIHNEK